MNDTTTVLTTSQMSTTAKVSTTSAKITTENSTTESTIELTTTLSSTSQVRIVAPSTTRIVTSPTTPQAILSSTKTISRMPERSPIFNQTDGNETKATDTLKDYEVLEDEHEVSDEPDFQPNGSNESDNIVNERYMMKPTSNNDSFDMSFIIKTCVIAISTVFLSFVIFVIAYQQYKKSTNPLNYKEKSENGSKKVNEEFSEIRYLTSDETLDFNLAAPDNATEL